jgi:uncharacterized repeat protein (TIGR03847 family)
MADARPFGELIHVSAESVGQPGSRRFRLLAMNTDAQSVFLWLEKEQLIALGDALETVLGDEAPEARSRALDDRPEAPVYPLHATTEWRIGQLSMGINRAEQSIVLIATEAGEEGAEAQALQLVFDYQTGTELREVITVVVASGRPPCPLCGAPLDSTHICPRKNGHHKQG